MSKYNDLQGSDTLRTMYPKINDNNDAIETDVTNLNNRVDNIVAQSGNDNTEIVDARNSIVKGKIFPVLGERLEEVEQDVINNTNTLTEHTNTLSTLVPDVDNIKNEISNAETVTIRSTTDSIIPTPPNANGQVNVGMDGTTRANLVKNGNLELGDTTHWSSGLTTENGYFKKTSNTSYLNGMQVIITNPIAGKKYTFSALGFRSGVGTSAVNRLAIVARDSSGSLINPAISLEFSNTTAERKSGVYTIPSGAKDVVIYPLAGTDVSVYFKEVLVEEGEILYHYISGVKSTVMAQKMTSVGKNLFDKSKWVAGKYGTTSFIPDSYNVDDISITIEKSGTSAMVSQLIKVKRNTYYTLSHESLSDDNIYIYDSEGNTLFSTANDIYTFNSGNNDYLIIGLLKTSAVSSITFNKPQLEEDTTATEYEPYKEDKSYILCTDSEGKIQELRSLPNGVNDEVIDGVLHKRTDKEVFNSNNNWTHTDTLSNVYRFDLNYSGVIGNVDLNSGKSNLTINNNMLLNEATINDYEHYYEYGDYLLRVFIDKSKIDSQSGSTVLEKFNNYLVSATLIYQLAQPIVVEANKPNPYGIDFKMEGSLTAYAGGSVQFETYYRYVHDTNTTSITLKKPISSIDKLFKYDSGTWVGATGTLSSDGTTITVTEAGTYRVEGPIRSEESTEGEKTLSFATNLAERINRIENLAVNNASILSEHEIMLLTLAIQIIELQGTGGV